MGPASKYTPKPAAAESATWPHMTTAMACVDELFSERELANGNTAGTFFFFSFIEQWDNVRTKINTKCRRKRRTVVKRLQRQI